MGAQTQIRQNSADIPLSGEPSNGGALHWYAVRVREGSEETAAEKCRQLVSPDVMTDCFFPKFERHIKLHGAWRVVEDPLYRGYLFAATRDARALSRALGRLSFPASLVGACGSSFAALAPSVQTWLDQALDSRHVLRASEGVIEDGALRVTRGPLAGSEELVRNVNRRKRMAFVQLEEGGESFLLKAGLSVPKNA